jgi:membrane protease YdiL (CAAX protease family)
MARHVALLGGGALLAAALRALLQPDDEVTQLDELKEWSAGLDADIDAVVVDLPPRSQAAAVSRIRASYRGRLIVMRDPTDDPAGLPAEDDVLVIHRPVAIAQLVTLITTDPSGLDSSARHLAAARPARGVPGTAPTAVPSEPEVTRLRLVRRRSGPGGGARAPAVASGPVPAAGSAGQLARTSASDAAAGTAFGAFRPVALAGTSLLVAYLGVVAASELAWRPLGSAVLASAACHGLLALLLCLVPGVRADARTAALLPPLIAVSVVRLISLAALPADVHPLLRVVIVGSPALVAVAMSTRLRLPEWPLVRPRSGGWYGQVLIGLLGVPLALLVWLVAPATAQVATGIPMIVAATILVVFAALPDELLFRGLLVPASVGVAGLWGLPLSSVAYALTYLPGGSAQPVLLAFLLGLALGWCRWRTGSVVGVVIAHGLLNVLVYLVLPVSGS